MDMSTTVSTMLNRAELLPVTVVAAEVAISANTMDAAPLRPTNDTSNCCLNRALNGVIMPKTVRGLDIKVMKMAIRMAGTATCGSCDGVDRRPSRKKMSTCMRPFTPSKNGTSVFLPLISELPRMMPTRYALK